MIAESAQQAQSILRDPSTFSWYIIPLLLIVLYTYFMEADKGNWSHVLAGLAFWGMDWFNEIWNGLVFHFSQFAPVWSAPGGNTAYLILVGLNIEISFMFAITGIAATLAMPRDKNLKILGINNRLLFAIVMSFFSVCVEIMLNKAGALIWEWPFWNAEFPYLIFLFGYMPFYLVCYWVFDMESRKKQIITVGSILGFDLAALLTLGSLGWI